MLLSRMNANELPAMDPVRFVESNRDQTTKVNVAYQLSQIRCNPSYLHHFEASLLVLSWKWSANLPIIMRIFLILGVEFHRNATSRG